MSQYDKDMKTIPLLTDEQKDKINTNMYRIIWIMSYFTILLTDREAQNESGSDEI